MHASRLEQMHREELEHASEEINMPGFGFEGGLLEQLQQQQDYIYNPHEASGIPDLDFSNEDEESRRRRPPFAKPVPKPFEKAWRSVEPFQGENNSNRMMNSLDSDDPFYSQSPLPPSTNFPRGPPAMLDDYSRTGGSSDFDSRGGGPLLKRPRLDVFNDGHWANAPTDRRGPSQIPHWRQNNNDSSLNPNNIVEESLDDTLTAARQGVSPFFQTATDEEMRGLNRTLRVFQK